MPLHAVELADKWQTPIGKHVHGSANPEWLKQGDQEIFPDSKGDSAMILLPHRDLSLPQDPIELFPVETALPVGTEVGWIGYPAVFDLCFFSGRISGSIGDFGSGRHAYLIDVVAISGVSGGPVIVKSERWGTRIIGSISAYYVNRAKGEALPGLSVAQDVSHLHTTLSHIKSFEEARTAASAEKAPPQS